MSTSAIVMMVIAWGYILGMVIYLFAKLLRKEREKKRRLGGIVPPGEE